jgi:hypothetical protein
LLLSLIPDLLFIDFYKMTTYTELHRGHTELHGDSLHHRKLYKAKGQE